MENVLQRPKWKWGDQQSSYCITIIQAIHIGGIGEGRGEDDKKWLGVTLTGSPLDLRGLCLFSSHLNTFYSFTFILADLWILSLRFMKQEPGKRGHWWAAGFCCNTIATEIENQFHLWGLILDPLEGIIPDLCIPYPITNCHHRLLDYPDMRDAQTTNGFTNGSQNQIPTGGP